MFENLSEKLERSFKILKGEGKITEINVAETLKEIRRALIDADGLRVQAKGRKAEQQCKQHTHNDHDQNGRRHWNAGNETADSGDQRAVNGGRRAAVDPVSNGSSEKYSKFRPHNGFL